LVVAFGEAYFLAKVEKLFPVGKGAGGFGEVGVGVFGFGYEEA
jgi:hypothetical protein